VRRQPNGGTFHIEDIQDQVELSLMRSGEHDVARAYVLYRAKRMEERSQQQTGAKPSVAGTELFVTEDGQRRALDMEQVRSLITAACIGLEKHVDAEAILAETVKNLYDGVPVEELHKSAILAARADGKRPCLQHGYCAPADAHDPQGSVRQGSGASRCASRIP
jgi:ribonucleoside-diphosphate reductase alpha chain